MKLASFIFGSITFLIQQYADKYKNDDLYQTLSDLELDCNLPRIQKYDFIVVGGGTAGCLVAGRLSEKFNVLLLESGGNPVPATVNTYLRDYVERHPAVNNVFHSTPQYFHRNGTLIKSYTGRMLGGSGSHNGNFYNRGSPYDYNDFALITGDDSWKYRSVLKHFKNFEDFVGKLQKEDERKEYYGTGGPITVDTNMPPVLSSWFESSRELGFKTGDPNAHQKEGFMPVTMSIKNGERSSTYTEFIKPYESTRKSLTVHRYSVVEQVLINDDKVAYGVAYKRHGIPQIAYVSKEVIVSCGAFSSPLLLMKSGIGPKKILEQAKIPIISEREGVGKNLRDHAAVILPLTVKKPNKTLFPVIKDEDLEVEINKYHESKRRGYLATIDVGPQAFITSSRAKNEGESNWPDIQIVLKPEPILNNNHLKLQLHIVLNRAKSAGEIKMNTDAYLKGEQDDTKLALIDFRLFTEASDAEVLIEGIELGLQIMENTTSFRNMDTVYTERSPKSCKNLTFRSHGYWLCYIQAKGNIWQHFAGTCQMGKENQPLTVVNSKLEVLGINGLRVVDASVLPRPTNANLNAAVMLVAEKASQEILLKHTN